MLNELYYLLLNVEFVVLIVLMSFELFVLIV
jgi:hypothetical protein